MDPRRWKMLKRLAWIVILAAAAAGCLSASGAVRGAIVAGAARTAPAAPVAPALPGQ
jgi:hypothetical protein